MENLMSILEMLSIDYDVLWNDVLGYFVLEDVCGAIQVGHFFATCAFFDDPKYSAYVGKHMVRVIDSVSRQDYGVMSIKDALKLILE